MIASSRGPFPVPTQWLNRPLALLLSAAVAVAGLGACGAGRNVLGTSTSPCFVALPVAKRAVHGRGTLSGIRLVDTDKLAGSGGRFMRDLLGLLPSRPPRDICVVAYTGSFSPGQVEMPAGFPPPIAARYAIVLVTASKPRLLGTFVVQHQPLAFSRVHVGI